MAVMIDLHGSSANMENLLRIRSGPANRLKETVQKFYRTHVKSGIIDLAQLTNQIIGFIRSLQQSLKKERKHILSDFYKFDKNDHIKYFVTNLIYQFVIYTVDVS